jgi:hypothetical protein
VAMPRTLLEILEVDGAHLVHPRNAGNSGAEPKRRVYTKALETQLVRERPGNKSLLGER